jgi:hypothetical protein
VGHACDELHLLLRQPFRASRSRRQHHDRERQKQQDSRADGEITPANRTDRCIQRSALMLHRRGASDPQVLGARAVLSTAARVAETVAKAGYSGTDTSDSFASVAASGLER